ncbi:MAG TPA: hypothetical protein H9667_06830 [Firmicutes bacterium]|nr:hypothetical protein [Bacillota bacterium]
MTGKGCRDFERILTMQNRTWSDFFKKLSNYPINYP